MTSQTNLQSLEEQRCNATILYCQVAGLGLLSEQLELSSVKSLVKAIFHKLDEIAIEHGGIAVKYVGDSILIAWGVCTQGNNDAERAVKAALAFHEAFKQLAPPPIEGSQPLSLKIGVHNGVVLGLRLGSMDEFTLVGESINLVQQMVKTADPGSIIISDGIYRQTRGVFQVKQLAPLSLKEGKDFLLIYKVEKTRLASGRMRYGSTTSMTTRMVGRETEIERFEGFFNQAMHSAQPVFAMAAGEAGIGKSRLLMEFTGKLEASVPAFYLISARALAQTARVPFHLWKLVWYNLFGLVWGEPNQTAGEKFLREVQRVWGRTLGPVPAIEAAQVVGSLIGLDWPNSPYLAKLIQDPLVRVNRAYELTRELLRRISLNRPTILLLDDLHWADEDSLDLLAYLIEAEINDAGLPLLILAAAQPEFLDHQQRLAKHCQMVWLNPLPTMADTVAKAYPDLRALPDAVLSSLAKYSTGNPYFLEEIIRGLLLAEGEDGENALSEALARLHTQPPESLNAILRSRLTDLTRMARATAMLSSVSGRVFWVGAIEAAIRAVAEKTTDLHLTLPSALDERSIQEGLGLLVKAELAFPRANSTYSSVQEYIFKHDLLRDIAYSLIPADFRRQYHQAVGQWMMGHDDLDFMIMAADQFEMAGAVADAISACEQAASRYEARGALGEAHMLIERARMIRDRGG